MTSLLRLCTFILVVFGTRIILAQEPDPRSVPLAKENPLYLDVNATFEDRVDDLISRMTLEEKAIALNHNGPNLERFGLRSDKWNQCLNGVQWDRPTTLFPTCIAMSATWDPDFIETEVARVISDEARAIYNLWRTNPRVRAQHKGLIYRDPVINIGRNPYWGRNHEAWGEDPYLTGLMGLAYVEGIQGKDPRYLKLASTLKHYAVNNVETSRFQLSADVSTRMLHEYWLPHFRQCVVEGQASSLMASYNAINDVPNNINHWLLTEVLKEQWGHHGFVVSDLGGVKTMVEGHQQSRMTYVDAVAQSLMAGCDFSDREFQQNIPDAVREGKLSLERLDDALRRVLMVRFRLGEFDPFESIPYSKLSPDIIASDEHREVALETARKSIVLLQNKNNLLPLDPSSLGKVAVIGPLADRVVLNNYNGRHENLVSGLQGIRNQLGDAVSVEYLPGCAVSSASDRVPTQIDREGGFSGGQSVKLDANEVGQFIEFPFEIKEAGSYKIELQYKTFPSRGIFQLTIDGMDVGEPLDMYEAEASYDRTYTFVSEELGKGLHKARFTVVGQADESQSFTGHFDRFRFDGPDSFLLELDELKFTTGRPKQSADQISDAAKLASSVDAVVLFLGTDQTVEQEGRDRTSLGLPGDQLKLAKAVIQANPNTVVVLQSAGPITSPWLKQNASAMLQAWWGGEEGGNAIADVLFGEFNPGGRMPHTVYASEEQVPPLDQYDIDVGFTYMYLKGEPLFAFGHGLSYTHFDYDAIELSADKIDSQDELKISIEVTNTGERAGDEVVQLYVKAIDSKVTRPKLQLQGFHRITIEAGQTKRVEFTLSPNQLSYFDEALNDFVIELGKYEVLIGSSSEDIRAKAQFRFGD